MQQSDMLYTMVFAIDVDIYIMRKHRSNACGVACNYFFVYRSRHYIIEFIAEVV
jgi:hypothetical protein